MNTITANFFQLLGVRPAVGRAFLPEEELFHGPHVAMISNGLWKRRYGGDPSLVGGTIQIDGVGHTVVGVLPEGFHLLLPPEAYVVTDAEVWTPLQYDYANAPPRNWTFFTVFGRLKPGVTFAEAQRDMDRIAAEFREEFPEHKASNLRIRAVPLHYDVVKQARPSLLILFGAVGLVLLAACANVAHLLLVRATAREGEFALRTALGASRWALTRQLMTESLVLAVGGGILGIGVSEGAIAALRGLHPVNLPRLAEVGTDLRVLAFTALLCIATAVGLVLMTVLGAVALVLTAVGVFGVISYSVGQRTREFGIRLALGEDPRQTRLRVVLGGMRLVLVSIGIGLAGSLVVTRLIAGLLYEVRPADPVTFAGIGLLLALVALLACYLPARRATRVDPALTLRSE